MREQFSKELNDTRRTREVKYWPGVFPEATIINFETLLQQNQYVSRVTNNDTVMDQYGSHLASVENNKHIKPFFTEFVTNYTAVETETVINCSFFWSFSDRHHSIYMHRDNESVLLIQGYGEVCKPTSTEEGDQYKMWHLKTGDALFLPRLTPHKSMPFCPRVTLSIGAVPSKPAL